MKRSRPIQLTLAIAVCTAAAAPTALAGGEPKNTPPFTRSATTARATAASVIPAAAIASARALTLGEPKAMRPFSRGFAGSDVLGRFLGHIPGGGASAYLGEPKNLAPFTRSSSR